MKTKWLTLTSILFFTTANAVTYVPETLSHLLKPKQNTQLIKPYQMQTHDQFIQQIYKNPKTHSKNLDTRIESISSAFLGKQYQFSPLGEGKMAIYDKNPLYRSDRFDCTTYVSTVLAIAESENFNDFQQNILRIRYTKKPYTFSTRNHFISTDWNTKNQSNTYLKDVTTQIKNKQGKSIAKFSTTLINKPAWFKKLTYKRLKQLKEHNTAENQKHLQQLQALSKNSKAIKAKLAYIPLNKLFNKKGQANTYLFKQIPTPSVIEIVRKNWNLKKLIGTNLLVSHMGFGLRINGQLIFRNASISPRIGGKVADMELGKYLLPFYRYDPSVAGINIQRIVLAKPKSS